MRNYPAFPRATPHRWAGSPRVPHPSATFVAEATTFDLHALGTPPALILSQDQTLHQNGCLPNRSCDRTFTSHLCVRRPRCARLPSGPKAPSSPERVGPPSSAAHSIPPPQRLASGNDEIRQPTCQGAALSSAREQKKTAQVGRAALGLERICVSAPIVFDDLQSDTLRSLARARFGACQQLLTEGDYRRVRACVSRDFEPKRR